MFRRIGLPESSGILSRISPVRYAFSRTSLQPGILKRKNHASSSEVYDVPSPPSGPPLQDNTTSITIWTLAAVGTIYTTCAVFENLNLKKETPRVITLFHRDKENAYDLRRNVHEVRYLPGLYSPTPWPPVNQLFTPEGRQKFRARLMPAEKFTYTIMGLNIGIHALGSLVPALWSNIFTHVPGSNRHFTLLTCIFGHSSLAHLGFNMYAFNSFMPALGQDLAFHSSIAHMAAFYLSTGVISSWAQALSGGLRPRVPNIPFLGASGALFALIGATAMEHPEAKFRIMFVPYDFAAQELLGAAMLFDLLGVCGAYKTLRLGHAAHLSGALLGLGYVHFQCEKKIWQPLCRRVYRWSRMSTWEARIK
ncbi:hypothetical protein DSL72_008963 [Monilinia vaccinii-corymbosi]|uniref:Peptidase S54 rhomboid domain-containing protein n=1 Tax=Monilinia vaccinii-corymbosi TaxID=61207 RepID=A0A8A3PS66_9HELO|nr:hypothetical protein DSL72_008963 [Monilinia vaccinii-corymbosi]